MTWDWSDLFALDDEHKVEQRRRLRDLKTQVTMLRSSQREGVQARGDLRDELAVLQFNFARTLLLLQSLTTTLLRKKVITADELKAVIAEIDLLDGQADSLLNPAAMPGMQTQPAERRSTEAALDDWARRPPEEHPPSVRELLKDLEDGGQG